MFVVIFEVQPKAERWDDYLDLAKLLKPELEQIDGFIDNERFASRRTEGRLLSLSTWRDEKSVIRWRTFALHHQVQHKGRAEILQDYHLRVGEVMADTHVPDGQQLLQQRLDQTEVGSAKRVAIQEGSIDALPPAGPGLIDQELFDSIYTPGKSLLLGSWRDMAPETSGGDRRHRQVRVVRDYGMQDRREAPQYYPAV